MSSMGALLYKLYASHVGVLLFSLWEKHGRLSLETSLHEIDNLNSDEQTEQGHGQ